MKTDDEFLRAAAEDAASKISRWLNDRGGSHEVSVEGDPPTVMLRLSVLSAHFLIDATRAHQREAKA